MASGADYESKPQVVVIAADDQTIVTDHQSCNVDTAYMADHYLELPSVIHDKGEANSTKSFKLSSKEDQKHIWELNQELKALNDDGNHVFSVMNTSPEDSMTIMRRKHSKHRASLKRKKVLGVTVDSSRFRYRRTGDEEVPGVSMKPETKSKSEKFNRERTRQCSSAPDEDEMALHDDIDIDSILEEKACNSNLSAINVKNLLRYVITNEHVLSMVHNSMEADGVSDAVFEPKLTRSRAKEMMEKQAHVPWPISSMKMTSRSQTKKLVEVEFSDSDCSSDEEYKPDKGCESGDESFLSSYTDEMGSSLSKLVSTIDPVQPTETVPMLEQKVGNDTVAEEFSKHQPQNEEHSEDTIALRTRSKLPLTDTPLEFIESNFIAPDITIDMYDSECDDEDWGHFLSEFLKPLDPNLNETNDDETNDPEYNFLEEEDVPDREDLRDDRAVKIPKKEIEELMAELLQEELNDADEDVDEQSNSAARDCISKETHRQVCQASDFVEPLFDVHRRQQLEEQIRKHVQLLTQVHLLCTDMGNVFPEKKICQTLLLELLAVGNNSMKVYGGNSSFMSHNLKSAVEIVLDNEKNSGENKPKSKKRTGSISSPHRKISSETMEILTHSDAFIYPNLLPVAGFRKPGVYKQNFIEAEDNLLALGLEQFMGIKRSDKYYCWKQIKDNMLPTKTVKQISNRTKNLRGMKSQDNPVKYYYRNKKAPPMTQPVSTFDPLTVKPLILHLKKLPEAIRKDMVRKHYKYLQPKLVTKELLLPRREEWGENACRTAQSQEHHDGQELRKLANEHSLDAVVSSSSMKLSEIINLSEEKKLVPVKSGILMPETKSSVIPKVTLEAAKIPVAQKPSPLKQVSPILKKYSPICLKKTGGNLNNSPRRILPKITFISHVGPRKLIPKAPIPVVMPIVPEKQPETTTKNVVMTDVETKNPDLPVLHTTQWESTKIEAVTQLIGSDPDSELEVFDDEVEDIADNEEDLAALMVASTTISVTPKQRQGMIRKRKKSVQEREDLALLAPDLLESDPLKAERATIFAQSYLQKAMDVIGENVSLFYDFLQLLHNFKLSDGNVVQLYDNVCSLLKDFPQLCEDFLVFLLPEQAMECGKFMEHLSLTKMQIFLRKIEVHFGNHPHHVQKILKVLHDLQQQENLTLAQLKESMLPLLRGQTHLVEEFLQLFPDETPSESQMVDYEEVLLPYEDEVRMNDDEYAYVRLPETEDVYGTKDCTCDCHTLSDKPKVQNRFRHCTTCGIKFIDGRIFLQTGKNLKPCRVIYQKQNIDHSIENREMQIMDISKFANNIQVISPISVSSLSPSLLKDSDEKKEATLSRVTRILKADEKPKCNPILEALEQISTDGIRCNLSPAKEDMILTSDTSSYASGSSEAPKKFSYSKTVSCEVTHKKTDFSQPDEMSTEQLTQDSSVDVGESNATSFSTRTKMFASWTRDLDRILLQTCQQLNPSKETFVQIAAKLKTKTPEEVESRFEELMDIFAEKDK